ncbi:XRE family transcriptional regulator [Aliarcobacter butzleri]|uniref:XRE family transcriptional regulator n=1 Tax=Aliarcobacter butzleri TaxID=28197 RepID=UPI00126A3C8E|nr:XRE family transcriptional regulator [Aliarcobacter butzleri]MCP3650216.1 XRE family transcriptional regulator [Arcobacter sp. DNRA7]MCR1816389.1 XRE family transcriptional regulator [Aliarcobacter butzleri]
MDNFNFEDKLLIAGLTKQTFSDLTNIPSGTITNWLTSRKGNKGKIPNWVEPYLNLYIENKENQIHIKKLYKDIKEGIL